jgi:hypothetical protein
MILLITLVVFAAAGGWIGWRQSLGWEREGRHVEPQRAAGVSRSDHAQRLRRIRRRKRLFWALLYAFFATLVPLMVALLTRGGAALVGG